MVESEIVICLRDVWLKGVALDVFETEPLPANNPLWSMPKVLLTPHYSAIYGGWQEKLVEMICKALLDIGEKSLWPAS